MKDTITLSEALLAPLNSIFQSQIHASRAFLGYLFQMGFRHIYTDQDKRNLKRNFLEAINKGGRTFTEVEVDNFFGPATTDSTGTPWEDFLTQAKASAAFKESEIDELEETFKILKKIKDEDDDKKRINELNEAISKLLSKVNLDSNDESELHNARTEIASLKKKWPDLYIQEIGYLDQNNNERILRIPNLALLPVKPLAVQNANFKFELKITKNSNTTDSIRPETKAEVKRPWFLIKDPKEIEGEFVSSQKEDSVEKTIKVDVTVGTVDLPYGLSKLISALTNISEDSSRSNPPK